MNAPARLPLPPSLYADTAVEATPTPPLTADTSVPVVIVEQGPAKSVLNQPQHARTQDFLRRVLHPL